MLQFISPPLPYYIVCGQDTYQVGDKHLERSNIGVFDLIFVTRGCLYLYEDFKDYYVSAGQYLILNPNSSHGTTIPCTEETHFYWIHFNTFGDWYSVDNMESNVFKQSTNTNLNMDTFIIKIPKYNHCQVTNEIINLICELNELGSIPSSTNKWKQQQLFSNLLLLFHSSVGKKIKNQQEVIAENVAVYLRQHYKETITYKILSEKQHFHENYIAICMKNTYGITPLEYLTRYRIEQAKSLLIHTNRPIGKIAEDTGFNSFQYFIRCFTKITKSKPMAFRNKYR